MGRAATATLSAESLLHNLAIIKRQARGAGIMAMVKANAYGHGIEAVATRLQGHVSSFGVASVEEGIALRSGGITGPIVLMEGAFEPDDILLASRQGFHMVFHNEVQLRWLEASAISSPVHAWLKVDTGMGRLGFDLVQAGGAYTRLCAHRHIIQPVGIMSHFACAEDKNNPFNAHQLHLFHKTTSAFSGPKSFANSAAIFNFPQSHHTVVRPGLSLYGVSPLANMSAADLGLRPVMTLHTQLISIRQASQGAPIGYGGHFVCPQDMPIGVVALGYGDGYPRTAQNGTPVLVKGRRCALVGKVSMDMMMVDLRPCSNAAVGDSVTLWGDGLPIEEVASHTQNIAYDLLCGVQSRVKCHWTDTDASAFSKEGAQESLSGSSAAEDKKGKRPIILSRQ